VTARATLDGRVCILAGGTGGIGVEVAHQLHREGAPLVLGFRADSARAERVVAELRDAGPGAVTTVAGDLRDDGTRRALIDAALELGHPYGLVVLAGDPARPRAGQATPDELARSFDDNYIGPVLLARDFRSALGTSEGAIVLLATMQAVVPFEGSLAYAVPKAALIHAARVLAKEWGGDDVRVNVVAPGVTAAGMAEESIQIGRASCRERV